MADDLRMALGELLRKAQGARDADVLREGVRVLSQALMELGVAQHVGAERYERTGDRTGQRNGYRERALVAVVQEVYVQGVSTRRGDDLVQALGLQGISKSQVSRLYQELNAMFVKVREQGRVVSQVVVLAIGVKATGEREVLGLDVGPSEDGAFWVQFLRGLVARGLSGVHLVISDAHEGLKDAIRAVLQGAGWPRSRDHLRT